MRRLFVSDLDGTLLNSEAKVSDITANLLNRAIDKGLEFTVSTARTPTTALKIVEGIHLSLPVMMMNGVLIYDMRTGQYIQKQVMDESVVMVVLGMIKVKGLNCFLYGLTDNQFYAYYDSVESTSLNYFRNERIMKYNKKFTEVEDLSLTAGKDIIYCMLREPKEKLEGLHRELSVVKGIKTDFYPDIYSEDYYMLEVYSEKASKKEALHYLRNAGHYDSVIGFGDNLNDKALMEASDYFYAVSNAHPEIQNMADSIIPSNDEDGVARFIEQMIKHTDGQDA
ncbi:MAG: HAD family hydrolase [Bacteroidales bacterium]|nr:HAD family hydrolase [Clostridium sp.]MCM1203215.1 HAD family hydrolase [Bacteroidales bacterium]